MRKIELSGKRFGRLFVLCEAEHKGKPVSWLCRCDCGKETVVATTSLRSGGTVSCGCHRREHSASKLTKHGQSRSKLYKVWKSMKQRCNDEKHKDYPRYGGRGIKVCSEWIDSYESFMEWSIRTGYCEGLSIDRIDNSKGYSPSNCTWSNASQQANNRRTTIIYEGKSLKEWCRRLDLNYNSVYYKVKHKLCSIEDALNLNR